MVWRVWRVQTCRSRRGSSRMACQRSTRSRSRSSRSSRPNASRTRSRCYESARSPPTRDQRQPLRAKPRATRRRKTLRRRQRKGRSRCARQKHAVISDAVRSDLLPRQAPDKPSICQDRLGTKEKVDNRCVFCAGRRAAGEDCDAVCSGA